MTSCILTLIKNEHEYLDEWIRYHINLGINHLFIFEDYDSDSHEEICSKYSEVTLSNIKEVIDIEMVEKRRNHIIFKRQVEYIKSALSYIHENFNYDWCFYIDADEYITIDGSYNNINEVLKEYDNYDAICLNWKVYGANGLIHKPDYTKKGIIETYTKPCELQHIDKCFWHQSVKTVYNMNNFTNKTFYSECLPSLKINWCKTNYTQDKKTLVYDKMFLRHYITKSWEEYVWKLKTRGMFYNNHRKYDSFFEMNSDMKSMRKELLDSINEQK
jgi:hypothetical protein